MKTAQQQRESKQRYQPVTVVRVPFLILNSFRLAESIQNSAIIWCANQISKSNFSSKLC